MAGKANPDAPCAICGEVRHLFPQPFKKEDSQNIYWRNVCRFCYHAS